MNKHEFIQILAEDLKLTQKQTTQFVAVFLERIMKTITAGEEINFTGFGLWKALIRASRTVMHPKTGLLIQIPESRVPVFKAGKLFKQLVKNHSEISENITENLEIEETETVS